MKCAPNKWKPASLIGLFLLFFWGVASAQPLTFSEVFYWSSSNTSFKGFAMVPTSSGNLVAGIRADRPMVMMVSDSGQGIWLKAYDTLKIRFTCALNTSDNAILLAGSKLYSGAGDAYLVKIDPTGDTIWSRRLDMGGIEYPLSVQNTNDGNYIIAGTTNCTDGEKIFIAKLSASGSLVWGKTIQSGIYFNKAFSAIPTPDQGILVAGSIGGITSGSPPCMTLLKLSADGAVLWAKKYSTSSTMAYDLLPVNGNYYCLGVSPSGPWIIAFDPAGSPLWGIVYSGYVYYFNYRPGPRLHQCSDGGFIFSRGPEENWDGQLHDVFRTDSNAAVLFRRSIRSYVVDVIPKNDNGYLIMGNGPLQGIDGDLLAPQIGLTKLDAGGNSPYSCAFPIGFTNSGFTPSFLPYTPDVSSTGTILPYQCNITPVSLYQVNGCVSIYPGVSETPPSEDISVYPNPSSGELKIVSASKKSLTIDHLEVYNSSGNLVYSPDGPVTGKFSLAFLADGLYILLVKEGEKIHNIKLAISHQQ